MGGRAMPRFAAVEAESAAGEVRREAAPLADPIVGAELSAAVRRQRARALRRVRSRRWSAPTAAPAACCGRAPVARITRNAAAAAARAVAGEESTKSAKECGVVVAATAACAAADAAATTAAHGGQAAAAAVMRPKAAPRGVHRQQGAGGLPLTASPPMPRLLARRGSHRAAAGWAS